MDDFADLKVGKHPVDRRPRRFHGVTLAAVCAVDAPADFKTRPARWAPWPDATDIAAARFFLDGEHAETVECPMPRYDSGVAPAADLGGDGDTVGRDVARGTGIGQHRRIRGDVAAAPRPQDQAYGLDNGTVDLQQSGAGLERRDHGFPAPIFSATLSSSAYRRHCEERKRRSNPHLLCRT